MATYQIRKMTEDEVIFAVESAAKEGWNPGAHDGHAFYAADPNGFLVGMLDNQPIGCISAVSYEGRFGFIGFYIVIPEFRGQGYGIQLWDAAMKRLRGHNIGLDGVIEQQENYKKSGFKLAYSNIRYEYINQPSGAIDRTHLTPCSKIPFEILSDFDQRFFPEKRHDFLKHWIELDDSFNVAFVEKDSLKGYSVIRKCLQGYKIGPLFADNATIAETMFLELCSNVNPNEKIYLDVPEVNEAAMSLAQKYYMQKVFGTARMYTGNQPGINLNGVFGVSTFELG